jgi:hypothetical protein
MPWSRGAVDERKRLIGLWEAGYSPTELARRFGVSRPTVYEVIGRWMAEGELGLEDRSRRPHSNGRQTSVSVMTALLNVKDRYPHYGPDKLVRLLRDRASNSVQVQRGTSCDGTAGFRHDVRERRGGVPRSRRLFTCLGLVIRCRLITRDSSCSAIAAIAFR